MNKLAFAAALLPVIIASNSQAASLNHLNSSLLINDGDGTISDWNVNGVDHLYDQEFYYRVGSSGAESNFSTMSWSTPSVFADRFSIQGGVSTLFDVEMTYTLTGASTNSTVNESIRITNTSASAISLHLFKYVDFDLNGNAMGDTVEKINANTFQQVDGNILTEMVLTNAPTAWDVGPFGSHYGLRDGSTTTLTDTSGPYSGDATYVMEWVLNLSAGQTTSFGSTTFLETTEVPVPAAAWLFGSALLGLASVGRTRRI
jgi:hypothetical protein